MTFKLITTTLFLLTLSACASHSKSVIQASALPDREEALGFFSAAYKSIRDTERTSYGMLYGIRDGIDSFAYDAQKDYYQDYQK